MKTIDEFSWFRYSYNCVKPFSMSRQITKAYLFLSKFNEYFPRLLHAGVFESYHSEKLWKRWEISSGSAGTLCRAPFSISCQITKAHCFTSKFNEFFARLFLAIVFQIVPRWKFVETTRFSVTIVSKMHDGWGTRLCREALHLATVSTFDEVCFIAFPEIYD